MGLGSILIAVVKFLLKSVLFVLKAVLYGGKLFFVVIRTGCKSLSDFLQKQQYHSRRERFV